MPQIYKTASDIQLKNQLDSLFADWKSSVRSKPKIEFHEDKKLYDAIEYFNEDGFFPGYVDSKPRVLFIGRESRYISGKNRIAAELERLCINNPNPQKSSYWRRIFYLAYGIKNTGKFKYNEIPYADEIFKEMLKSADFNFAIMNISKYSNDAEDGANADYKLINRSLEDSLLESRNFVREEIELLNPDIIISANLWNGKINEQFLEKIFPSDDFSATQEDKNKTAYIYDFILNDKKIKFLDLYHFSAIKNDEETFYNPAMELLFGN